MTSTKDITAKFAVAAVAVAMIFSAFAPAAQAQTTEDLQQMINDLLAQVAELQAGLGGDVSAPAGAAGVCPYTWTRDLTNGSEGADVMKLQEFLNSYPDLRVSATGAGSMGMETMYYGPATAAAVSKMQVMFRAEVLTPNGLVNPTGYFGASSRAKANDLCIADTTTGEEEGEEGTEEEEDDSSDMTLGGEASLDTFEISEGDDADEVQEGDEDVVVAELAIEFNDGDASISRIDFQFDVDTVSNPNADNDVFDNLDEVSLWVDGDKVASMDASDEDDYLDEDDGTIRFSNLDIFAGEDDEITIMVAVSMQNNIDGLTASDEVEITVSANAMRFFDADGVATTETSQGDLGDLVGGGSPAATETFTVSEEGSEEELDLASSSNEPDEQTLPLDETSNEEFAIFAFELDADDSDGDIEINEIMIDIVLSSTTGAIDDVINDFRIEIDGDEFDADGYVGTGDTVTLVFDVDGDFTVEAGETAEVVLFADFEDMDNTSMYQGVTVIASVAGTDIDAEGVNDITLGGSATVTGEAQTLRSVGISAEFNENDSDTSVNGNTLTFEFVVDVTAFGEDSVLTVADFNYSLLVGAVATGTINVSLDATDPSDEDPTGTFTLDEDDSAEYVFTVRVTTTAANQAGLYTVTLDDVNGEVVDENLEDVANHSS
jgi:hypothetical protein